MARPCSTARGSARARWWRPARSSRPRPRFPRACWRSARRRKCAVRSPALRRNVGCAPIRRAIRRSRSATRHRSSPADVMAAPRRIAFFVFPRLTLLDLIGGYDALRRVAAMSIDSSVTHRIIGTEAEIVDESGLMLKPDAVYEDLSGFDLLYVAGGLGTVAL